jgi:hypothetical protein
LPDARSKASKPRLFCPPVGTITSRPSISGEAASPPVGSEIHRNQTTRWPDGGTNRGVNRTACGRLASFAIRTDWGVGRIFPRRPSYL